MKSVYTYLFVVDAGIERTVLGDEPAVIPKLLRSEHVAIRRRKDEGNSL